MNKKKGLSRYRREKVMRASCADLTASQAVLLDAARGSAAPYKVASLVSSTEGGSAVAKPNNIIAGVHRVKRRLSDGSIRKYHYVFRGGPCFWTSSKDFGADDMRYVLAYNDAIRGLPSVPAPGGSVRGQTRSVVARYRTSAEFVTLKPRTREGYER
jgi:hypothetical protein